MAHAHKPRPGRPTFVSPALAVCVLSFALAAARAAAQDAPAAGSSGPSRSPSAQIPTPDQLEPGVNTTAPTPPLPAAAGGGEAERPPAAAPTTVSGPASAAKGTTAAKGATATQASRGAQAANATKTKAGKGPSRLELDATEITGNRELPKVLYIVPWKRSALGELVGRPVNSLLDEALEPLDRDVFQRENRYYNGLKGAAGAPKPAASPGTETNP